MENSFWEPDGVKEVVSFSESPACKFAGTVTVKLSEVVLDASKFMKKYVGHCEVATAYLPLGARVAITKHSPVVPPG
jgi:hypothetical protein